MPINLTERNIDHEFIRKIKEISGEDVYKCMQCGTCSAACPVRELMDLGPTRVIHTVQFGQHDRVTDSNTVWICASCHTCEARCPRELDIPKIMEAIRLLTLRLNEDLIEPYEIEQERVAELPPIAMVASFRKHTA